MKRLLVFAIVSVFLFIASGARAEFTQAEWERMKTGEVVVTEVAAQNPDGSQRMQFMAKMYVKATRREIWKHIRDYNHFHEFMPKLKKATILKREGETYWVKYETKVLWVEADYYLVLKGTELYKRVDYKLDRSKENDIRDASGYWILEDAPDGSGTVVSYTSNIDTGIPAPAGVTKKVSKMSLPQIVKNVRMRIESGGTWKKPEGS